MLREIALFAKRVGWNWLVAASGALLGGASLISNGFGLGSWPRSIFIAVSWLLTAWAFFATWREELRRREHAEAQLQAIQDAAPYGVLRVFVEGSRLMLSVTNEGAQGLFRVFMETEPGSQSVIRRSDALWEETNSHLPIQIVTGLSARAQIALLDEDRTTNRDDEGNELPHTWGWTIAAAVTGHGFRPGRLPRLQLNDNGHEFCTLRVMVSSEPQMRGNVTTKRLRFVGREVIELDSGERLRPTPLVYEDPEDDYY